MDIGNDTESLDKRYNRKLNDTMDGSLIKPTTYMNVSSQLFILLE